MGNFSLGIDPLGVGKPFGDIEATFYVTQRKIPYAPCLGHERLVDLLNRSRVDVPRARFLEEDRANLKLVAERLKYSKFPGRVLAVPEGTIVFAQEPLALVSGPFAMTQFFEVAFEHAFDLPMTTTYQAMKMREVVGKDIFVSDFSLRRSGDFDRSVEVSKYLYIGGCDDTSNLEAAFLYGIVSMGTQAHYLIQAFMALVSKAVKEGREIPKSWRDEKGNLKHPERICFESWLDAHPNGTTCLVDTLSLESGVKHAIEAALSSPARKAALKAIRIDSGDLVQGTILARKMLHAAELDTKIVLTGDLDAEKVEDISKKLKELGDLDAYPRANDSGNGLSMAGVMGVAGGTRFTAEIDRIAGVIFKMVDFGDEPTLKCSGTPSKETLPGKLQLWRCEDENGKYVCDVITRLGEQPSDSVLFGTDEAINIELAKKTPLLQPFWEQGRFPELKTVHELKEFVEEQKKRFITPLGRYGRERVVLSPALSKLKEQLQKEYLKNDG
jgi:nicotinate phosphoribosyltransferase